MIGLDDELATEYLAECREHLATLETDLVALEQGGAGRGSWEDHSGEEPPAVRTRGGGCKALQAARIAGMYSSQRARRSWQRVHTSRCSSSGADASMDNRPRL